MKFIFTSIKIHMESYLHPLMAQKVGLLLTRPAKKTNNQQTNQI